MIVGVEVFVLNRLDCVPNYEVDPITAVYFVVHNELAQLDLNKGYRKVNALIVNK